MEKVQGSLLGKCLLGLVLGLIVSVSHCVQGKAAASQLQMLLPLGQKTASPFVQGSVTLVSEPTLYVSPQAGARNQAAFTWSADYTGNYVIRLSTDCSNGAQVASGAYQQAGDPLTINLTAASMAPGANPICVRLTAPDNSYAEKSAYIVYDDQAPTVVLSPGAGDYGTSPTVAATCNDPGGAGCDILAYRIAADPDVDTSGVVAGTAYTAAITIPDLTNSQYRFVAMDRAGNKSAVLPANYRVNSTIPTITTASVTPNDGTNTTVPSKAIKAGGSLGWSFKTNVAGSATYRLGGTDCNSGPTGGILLGSTTWGTVNPATTRGISIPSLTVTNNLIEGNNTIRLCVKSETNLVASTTLVFARDITGPTVTSFTAPGGTVDPQQAKIILNFSEPMWSGSVAFSTEGVSQAGLNRWISSQSLEVQFPPAEMANVTWTVTGTDLAGNIVSAPPSGSFQAGMIAKRRFAATDTSQMACFDDLGNTVLCTGTGQNGEHPGFLPAAFSAAFAPSPLYPDETVVVDNNTGLMWMACPNGQAWSAGGCISAAFDLTAIDAYSFAAIANTTNADRGYAELKGWRLPTMAELATIRDFGGTNGPQFYQGSPAGISRGRYHSGTLSGATRSYRLSFFGFPVDSVALLKTDPVSSAIFVRDPNPGATPDFVDNGDDTVTDPVTALVWQKCSAAQAPTCTGTPDVLTFAQARDYCLNLALAGRTWRLPNIRELMLITDYSASARPFTYPEFSAWPGAYWTSTADVTPSPQLQFAVQTLDGTTGYISRAVGSGSALTRCVSGP